MNCEFCHGYCWCVLPPLPPLPALPPLRVHYSTDLGGMLVGVALLYLAVKTAGPLSDAEMEAFRAALKEATGVHRAPERRSDA